LGSYQGIALAMPQLLLGGAALQRCDNRMALIAALAAEVNE